jgi:hypothetical protein
MRDISIVRQPLPLCIRLRTCRCVALPDAVGQSLREFIRKMRDSSGVADGCDDGHEVQRMRIEQW